MTPRRVAPAVAASPRHPPRRRASDSFDERSVPAVLPWLVRLRWVSVLGFALAIPLAAWSLGVRPPVAPLAILIGLLAANNAWLAWHLRAPEPRRTSVGAGLLVDCALLTGILLSAGGPVNPFSLLYLVGITLAAVALGQRWALVVAVVSVLAYGSTFVWHRPIEFTSDEHVGVMRLHLVGMWIVFAAAAALIAHFVGRASEALDRRDRELADTRARAAHTERLAALMTLGAGAAHELATPLGSIRIAAGELSRAIAAPDAASADLVDVIRHEVDRCTVVLDQLSGRASASIDAVEAIELPRLIDEIRHRLGASRASRLVVTLPAAPRAVRLPAEPLRQALVAVLRNAFDASSADGGVELTVEHTNALRFRIVDRGPGMTAETVARVGEPFYTSKPAGSGLGLGVFLARSFAEQMGGRLDVQSTPRVGTSVVIEVPAT